MEDNHILVHTISILVKHGWELTGSVSKTLRRRPPCCKSATSATHRQSATGQPYEPLLIGTIVHGERGRRKRVSSGRFGCAREHDRRRKKKTDGGVTASRGEGTACGRRPAGGDDPVPFRRPWRFFGGYRPPCVRPDRGCRSDSSRGFDRFSPCRGRMNLSSSGDRPVRKEAGPEYFAGRRSIFAGMDGGTDWRGDWEWSPFSTRRIFPAMINHITMILETLTRRRIFLAGLSSLDGRMPGSSSAVI